MKDLFGYLGVAPGLAIVLVALVATARSALRFGWEWRERVQKVAKTGEYRVPPWEVSITAALTELTKAVQAIGEKADRETGQLESIQRTVDSIIEGATLRADRQTDMIVDLQRTLDRISGRAELLTTREDLNNARAAIVDAIREAP